MGIILLSNHLKNERKRLLSQEKWQHCRLSENLKRLMFTFWWRATSFGRSYNDCKTTNSRWEWLMLTPETTVSILTGGKYHNIDWMDWHKLCSNLSFDFIRRVNSHVFPPSFSSISPPLFPPCSHFIISPVLTFFYFHHFTAVTSFEHWILCPCMRHGNDYYC